MNLKLPFNKVHIVMCMAFVFLTQFYKSQETTIHIKQGKLYKPNGEKLTLRGVNYNFMDNGNILMTSTQQTFKTYVDEVAKTGANAIRIPWFTDAFPHWRKNYPNIGSPQAALENGALSNFIGYCQSKGLTPILEVHDFTCKSDWATFTPAIMAYWTQPKMLELIEKHKAYLIINIANEFGKVSTASTLTTFKTNYSDIVKFMRNAGISVPIMIDAPNCGIASTELMSVSGDIIAADPLKKLIFSGHSYWTIYAPTTADVKKRIQEALASGAPFVFGEVSNRQDRTGIQADGVINIDYVYQEILTQSCEQDFGWMVWAFRHDWNKEREMSNTGTFANLTPFGKDVVYNPVYGLLGGKCDASLGINDLKNNKSIVYPNPAKDFVYVRDTKNLKAIEIYDFSGRLVKSQIGNFSRISVTDLNTGLFLVKLIYKENQIIEKLQIK